MPLCVWKDCCDNYTMSARIHSILLCVIIKLNNFLFVKKTKHVSNPITRFTIQR